MPSSRSTEGGQASVELVAILPALAVAFLIVAQLVVVGHAVWTAGNAARAGARAAHVGGDAEAAALSALPSHLRKEARIGTSDGVEVRVQAPLLLPGGPRVPVQTRARLTAGEAGGG
jgi:hypothetical protein